MEDELAGSNTAVGLRAHFRALVVTQGTQGPIGELIAALSGEHLDRADYDRICGRHGIDTDIWFRRQVLDLVLGYVTQELEKGPLSAGAQRDLRELRHFLQVTDGEFMKHRAAEVATLLREQFDAILADFVIDDAEELQQVELQALFGLSYDDYLALIRGPLERAVAELSQLSRQGNREGRSTAVAKLAALDPMYRLATARPRRPGALY
jgi:hypothetical protein